MKTVSGPRSPCENSVDLKAADKNWRPLLCLYAALISIFVKGTVSSCNCCIISSSADKATTNILTLASLHSSQDVLFPFSDDCCNSAAPLETLCSTCYVDDGPDFVAAKLYQKSEERLIICTDLWFKSNLALSCAGGLQQEEGNKE